MKNLYLPISIIIGALIVGGVIFYTQGSKLPEGTTVEEKGTVKVGLTVGERDHIRGNPEAKVTIIEFSDFQCPFCASFHPTMKRLVEAYQDQVSWNYRHFPLDSIHPEARPAAEASECAADQDKFWEFSDELFENQSKLGGDFYQELAKNLGLDTVQFTECVSSREHKDKVEADLQEGVKAGVRGTPASFINGILVEGAVSYETLRAAVENALE